MSMSRTSGSGSKEEQIEEFGITMNNLRLNEQQYRDAASRYHVIDDNGLAVADTPEYHCPELQFCHPPDEPRIVTAFQPIAGNKPKYLLMSTISGKTRFFVS